MLNRIVVRVLILFVSVALVGIFGATAIAEKVKPIRIGCPGSFKATAWASGGLKGVQLAVDEINAAGGVNVGGVLRPIELISIDTRDEEAGVPISEALLAMEKLILDKKVDAIVGGPTMSESSMAVIDLVAKYNIVDLVCMGTWTPGWPKKVGGNIKKYRTSFKMTGNVAHVLPMGVDLLEEIRKVHGFDTIYVVIQDVLFARKAVGVLKKLSVKKGWKILGEDAVPMGTTDYSPELLKAKKSGAKILLYWWADTTGAILYKQFLALEVPAIPFGFSPAAQEPELYHQLDGKVEYFTFTVGQAATTSTKLPGAVKFQQAYKKRFGKEPFGGSVSAYMGPYVFKDAVERAGSLETDALINALEKTDYMGISGRIRFDNNHESIYSYDPKEGIVHGYSQWIKGKQVSVWPPVAADAEIVLPPWMKK